jgi:hypothetical protein
MKQIINLPGYSIQINEHEGVIVTSIDPVTITDVDFEELSGVYIFLANRAVVSLASYAKQEASGVLLKTKHASIIISKEDLPEMSWDEAIKYNPFDRHEAIEIHNNKKQINEALKLIGGDPIKDEWYWTRDETSTGIAWIYNGPGGNLGTNFKSSSLAVRPVTAF